MKNGPSSLAMHLPTNPCAHACTNIAISRCLTVKIETENYGNMAVIMHAHKKEE